MASELNYDFFNGSASDVAPRLLGCVLERRLDGLVVKVKIVETEAYDQTDVASHSYKGRTQRTEVMFGKSGYLYVYFTYGMHYCCNVVVGKEGHGAAVLIRAVEPLDNVAVLSGRRRMEGVAVTNGPAKLCQALDIDMRLNGHNLRDVPLRLVPMPALGQEEIVQTTRIGISQGKDVPWRFYVKDNPYVSKL